MKNKLRKIIKEHSIFFNSRVVYAYFQIMICYYEGIYYCHNRWGNEWGVGRKGNPGAYGIVKWGWHYSVIVNPLSAMVTSQMVTGSSPCSSSTDSVPCYCAWESSTAGGSFWLPALSWLLWQVGK